MDRLQEYLENEYLNEKKLLNTVDETIKNSVNTLIDEYRKEYGWNYSLSTSETVSYSTTSMVSFALNILSRKTRSMISPISSGNLGSEYICKTDDLAAKQNAAIDLFFNKNDEVRELKSETYGTDNVFVLLWLLKNLFCADQINFKKLSSVLDKCKKLLTGVVDNITKSDKIVFALADNSKIESTHTFPMLKSIEMYTLLNEFNIEDYSYIRGQEEEKEYAKNLISEIKSLFKEKIKYVKDYFIKKIHFYLSLASIKDSNFDAAELVFSLEGLLLLEDNNNFDENLLNKVFEVLSEKQEINIYWRPLTPFIRSVSGMALLPLSVEIATSLLNICIRLQEKGAVYFENYFEIFKKYTVWICSRQIVVFKNDKKHFGWCSEHVFKQDEIQLWETSQVLVYLVMFNEMLQELIANKGLRLSGLEKEVLRGEPHYLNNDEPKDIYKDLKEYFKPSSSVKSILLYGPPGTGKSSIAGEIARYKKWPLISLSPSNFIASGIDLVESKTKNIFKVLCEQRRAVVFFDEIDRLILDRDSDEYNNQGDMFQCMTPSMLVKLKALHDTPEIIFILATNYAERIDDAIIRPGRIDRQVLVCPPDTALRKEIIKELFDKNSKPIKDDEIEKIAIKTAMGTFMDIKEFLETNGYDCGAILNEKCDFKPMISTDLYKKRLEKNSKNILKKEFIKILYIRAQEDELICDYINEYAQCPDKMPEKVRQQYNEITERDLGNEMLAATITHHLMKDNEVIYVSGPITTGEKYLEYKEKGGVFDSNSVKRNNISELNKLCTKIKKKKKCFVINPASLEMGLDWTQEEYYKFWDVLLSSKSVTEIVFANGWEYSIGCCNEYLSALKYQKITKDAQGRIIKPEDAIDKIKASITRFSETGDSKFYEFENILQKIKKEKDK